MVDDRDVLAREVDEELRREQLLKLWQQYGTYVVGAVALLIAGVGGWKFYEARKIAAEQAAGTRFSLATREAPKADAKPDAPTALDDIARNGPSGYATLARLRLAAADTAAGKKADAIAKYDAVAKDRRTDPLLADFARLQIAMLTLDTGSWTDIQNQLTPLAAEQSAWRFSARELLGLAALKAGREAEAKQEFERLMGDRSVPPSIAERSRLMLAMLTEAELAKATGAPKPATEAKESPKADGPTKTDGKGR
ncbi:MAG: tetratricopeptide repeat protein [Hyphomicrobiaceae bacterium]|nr:tetratricopeptide repeat protein [Hyphomicrobiaceae bacterium]